MRPKKNRLLRYLIPVIAAFGAVIGWSSPSSAFVQQFVIDSTNVTNYNPIPLGSSIPGPAVSYTTYTGRIFGALAPANPLNSVIVDIGLASPVYTSPAPPAGDATYIANFQITTPTDPAARSGLLIYWVVNRGGTQFSPSAMIQGATYVESGWQGDLLTQCSGAPNTLPVSAYPCVSLANPTPGYGAGDGGYGTPTATFPFFNAPAGLGRFVIQVPVATTDGNPPNGTNTIAGPVYGQINKGTTGSTGQMIMYESYYVPYQPASFDTNQAQFWSDAQQTTDGVDSGVATIPSAQWEWAYCPNGPNGAGLVPNDPYWICLLNGATFNPNRVYEMVFQAANPLVQGIGFAATRDLISFLRYGTTAPSGGSNPVAGTVTKTWTTGQSQSGAFIRGSLFYGFNEDEDGRIVFDGAYPDRDGRMMWMNERFEQANVLSSIFMPGDEAPVWWADFPNQARGLPAAGILDRCNATGTCPQIMETFGSTEFYAEKMGADFVGFCGGTSSVPCTTDIPVPSNVYRYFLPGTKHGGGSGGFNWAAPGTLAPCSGCLYPTDPVPETESFNALNAAFAEFLMNGTPMPQSFGGPGGTYPTLASGELALATNQEAVGYPNIPGFPYGGNQAWPPFVYNYGPGVNYTQETGITSIWPPQIQQVLAPYVPTVNADGNENVGSDPSVLFDAPLGTYIGWNIYASYNGCTGACGYAGQQAQLSGSYWPFWDTQAHRVANGDPRLSLEERYGSHSGYNCFVTQVANRHIQRRLLLASDASMLIAQAAASTTILPSPFAPTSADKNLANNILCGTTDSHDFAGGGMSGLAWRNINGDVDIWLMSGTTVVSNVDIGNVPPPPTTGWAIVGQRDFNGDGNADLLWRNTNGDVAIWLMNGTQILSATDFANVPTSWSIVGTADLSGNGMGDILWRNSNGDLAIWMMNGTQVTSSVDIGNVSTAWSVAGTGNFNGTTSEIVWRNTNGDTAIWQMNGTAVVSTTDLGIVPTNWTLAGTGDFNGDGSTDLLWRNSSGDVVIWLMSGTTIMSSADLGILPTSWSFAETGDFNGDHFSDIVWRNANGDVAVWLMNGTTIQSATDLGNVPTGWTIQSANVD